MMVRKILSKNNIETGWMFSWYMIYTISLIKYTHFTSTHNYTTRLQFEVEGK